MTPEAIVALSQSCRVMRSLIRRVGTCELKPKRQRSPYESLVRAVAHQQLTGKAAETILGRFLKLFPGHQASKKFFPTPEEIVARSEAELRGVGFSRAKAMSIKDIAAKTIDNVVPNNRQIVRLDDDAIVERLVQVRGVGRWTVEILLIFQLGRPDVWPVHDYGVRNGYRLAYQQESLPTPKELAAWGERWRPHRTTAAWYLWRAVDLHRQQAKPD